MKVNNTNTKEDMASTGIYSVNETVKAYKPLQIRFKKDCKFKADDQVTILKTEDYQKLITLINESKSEDDKKLKSTNSELLLKIEDLESKINENKKSISDLKAEKEKWLEDKSALIEKYTDKLENANDIKNKALIDKKNIKSDYEILKIVFENTLNDFALLNENVFNSLILEVIKDTTETNNKQFKRMGLFSRIRCKDIAEPIPTNTDTLLDKSLEVIKAEINKKREWLQIE